MTKKTDNDGQLQMRPLLITGSIIIIVLLGSAISALLVSRQNTESITNFTTELMSLYTESIEDELSSIIDETKERCISLINLSPTSDDEDVRRELRTILLARGNVLKNIHLFRKNENGEYSVVYPLSPISEEQIDDYMAEIKELTISPASRTAFFTMLYPYEEPLGGMMILPFLVLDPATGTMAIFEVNLTLVLFSETSVQSNNILNSAIPFDIKIFDRDGLLIETSENLKQKVSATLVHDPLYDKFTSYDNNLQLFLYMNDDDIWMMKKTQDTGLAIAIRAPASIIVENTSWFRNAILGIALLCLASILLLIYIAMKLSSNYQIWLKMQSESRFEALQSKMKPHLLFNTLDNIVCAIEEEDPERALQCIKALAYILQVDLRDTNAEIPLPKQIRYVRSYVSLQAIRYNDKFTFNLDIDLGDLSVDELWILRFCIQPLVENCFVHSVYQGVKQTDINVRYSVENDSLVISVRNTGSSITRERLAELKEAMKLSRKLDTSHIGLMSIDQRIKLRYGSKYGLTIGEPEENCFSVTVRLPLISG